AERAPESPEGGAGGAHEDEAEERGAGLPARGAGALDGRGGAAGYWRRRKRVARAWPGGRGCRCSGCIGGEAGWPIGVRTGRAARALRQACARGLHVLNVAIASEGANEAAGR